MSAMDAAAFAAWADRLLDLARFAKLDDSLNGLQVGRSAGEVRTVAFAVDASLESIGRARQAGAELLFVHHGLFWGQPAPVTGGLRRRLAELLAADMALYACHLPLDAHPELGNNAVLAGMLGLADSAPFGEYHGIAIGRKGRLDPPIDLDEAVRRVLPNGDRPRLAMGCGPAAIRSAAVVSGGAPFEVLQAIGQGLDLYVTGEPSHSVYHLVAEAGINFVAAGHYATETHGVRAVARRVETELGLRTVFLELPTGL